MENMDILNASKESLKNVLDESQKLTKYCKYANIAILLFGLLVFASFIVFVVFIFIEYFNEKTIKIGWIFVFGSIGLAGIIASLIVNPNRSIVKKARQLIQIQISYSNYLKQLEIIGKADDVKGIEKSKRLEEVTNSLQETLCKYFDSPPSE
jgi:predicted PurR-regulated permease PerM